MINFPSLWLCSKYRSLVKIYLLKVQITVEIFFCNNYNIIVAFNYIGFGEGQRQHICGDVFRCLVPSSGRGLLFCRRWGVWVSSGHSLHVDGDDLHIIIYYMWVIFVCMWIVFWRCLDVLPFVGWLLLAWGWCWMPRCIVMGVLLLALSKLKLKYH